MNSSRAGAETSSQFRAYEFIKERIVSFELKPGQRLKAQELAAELRLSRTPVREALGRLEQEGLVAKDAGWGYAVRAMTLGEVMDLYRVREVLEVEAALEAVTKIDDALLDVLGKILTEAQRLASRGRVGPFLTVTRTFHGTLADATDNGILRQMLSMISDRIQILGAMVLRENPRRAKEILEENAAILCALREKDPRAIEASVRSHIRRAKETVMQFIVDPRRSRLYVGDGGLGIQERQHRSATIHTTTDEEAHDGNTARQSTR